MSIISLSCFPLESFSRTLTSYFHGTALSLLYGKGDGVYITMGRLSPSIIGLLAKCNTSGFGPYNLGSSLV